MVDDAAIRDVLVDSADASEAAERLIALALRAGGPDNISVVVADAVPADLAEPSEPAEAPDPNVEPEPAQKA